MNPVLLIAIIGLIVAVIVYIWDDLTEELRIRVEEDEREARTVRRISHGQPARARSLVVVSEDELVTPRGVVIPPGWLNGGLDVDDALDWLDYVETLG